MGEGKLKRKGTFQGIFRVEEVYKRENESCHQPLLVFPSP